MRSRIVHRDIESSLVRPKGSSHWFLRIKVGYRSFDLTLEEAMTLNAQVASWLSSLLAHEQEDADDSEGMEDAGRDYWKIDGGP